MAKRFKLTRNVTNSSFRGRILTDSYSNTEVGKTVEIKNRRLNALILALVIAIVVGTIATIFVIISGGSGGEPEVATSTVISTAEADHYTLKGYERPNYDNLDFYTALYNIGLELDNFYIDLVLYYENPESKELTLVKLKERRDLIYTTVDSIINADVQSNNSELVGASQGILQSLDTTFHYADQILYFLETDIAQVNSYYYSEFKDGINLYLEYLYNLLEERGENTTSKVEEPTSN